MSDIIVPCAIRCNKDSVRRMWDVAELHPYLVSGVRGDKFYCLECEQRWAWTDFSGAFDPESVTCSNCYSSKVLMTSMHLELQEEPTQ